MNSGIKVRAKKAFLALVAFTVATAIWLPCLHLFFRKPLSDFYQAKGVSPKANQLAARHLQLWTDPALRQIELKKMRASNAEWDFMGRSFVVWSVVNMGLREPQMPKGNPALSEDELHRVRMWIAGGARDDSAAIAARTGQRSI